MTAAKISDDVFDALLTEIAWDQAIAFHREARRAAAYTRKETLPQPAADDSAEIGCPVCGRGSSAARYAAHLERCLGLGRNGGRRKRKTDTPGSVYAEASDSELELPDAKKKKTLARSSDVKGKDRSAAGSSPAKRGNIMIEEEFDARAVINAKQTSGSDASSEVNSEELDQALESESDDYE